MRKPPADVPVLHLGPDLPDRTETVRAVVDHRRVLAAMAKAGFQSRYKQARLGIAWAVAAPLVQASVLAFIFSRLIRFETGFNFALYVLSGMVPWAYLSSSVNTATTSIVEGSDMATKVWFPRALLPMVGPVTGLVTFVSSLVAVVVAVPVLGESIGARLALLVPAVGLLVGFTLVLCWAVAAADVYFRDIRHGIGTVLLLWFYLTPVLYPTELFRGARWAFDVNPATGVLVPFRMAIVGAPFEARPVLVSAAVTLVLFVTVVEVYRRHDRLFVDRL